MGLTKMITEAYLALCETYLMEFSVKIVDDFI